MNPFLDLAAHPIVAHRGASGYAPENTLGAFRRARELGADALELDVRLSADGVPVVMHDPTLDRTTDRHGTVAAYTVAQLRQMDAGHRFTPDGQSFPFRGRDVRIPTLAEVLEEIELPLLVEIKEPRAQQAVRDTILRAGAAGRCVIASEYAAALAVFGDGAIPVGAASDDIARLYFGTLLRRRSATVPYRFLSVPLRHRGLPIPTRRFVAAARALGCAVHVWTVNDGAIARALWHRGVAGIVTNYPDRIAAQRVG